MLSVLHCCRVPSTKIRISASVGFEYEKEEDKVVARGTFNSASTDDSLGRNLQGNGEEHLVSAARDGHHPAFGELCKRHSKKIFHTALRITRNREDAEDALQDSFLSAFLHLRNFDGRSNFSTWLTRIAINAALMKLRKNRASREIAMEESVEAGESLPRYEPVDYHPDPEESYAQQERKRILTAAVRGLRPGIRQVVEIRQLQAVSMKETAQTLGISVAAAKGRLFHGRVALRRALRLRTAGPGRVRRAA
jgi:RNA polymerase sigma factor (sigma-70 family)